MVDLGNASELERGRRRGSLLPRHLLPTKDDDDDDDDDDGNDSSFGEGIVEKKKKKKKKKKTAANSFARRRCRRCRSDGSIERYQSAVVFVRGGGFVDWQRLAPPTQAALPADAGAPMEGCGAGVLFLGVDDDFELLLPPPQGTASQNQDHEPGRTIEGVYKEDEEEEEVGYGAMHHDDDEDDGDSLVDDSSSSRMRSLPQPSSPVPPPQPALPAEYLAWRRIAALRPPGRRPVGEG